MPRHPFRVGRSRTGLGLFATEEIAKNAFIVEYRGRKLTTKQAEAIEAKGSNRYLFELNSRWTIDGSSRRNIARYTNHSCRPNAEAHVSRGKIVFRAAKRIRPGEEITFNYGRSYFDIFIKPKGCKCPKCDPLPQAAAKAPGKLPTARAATARPGATGGSGGAGKAAKAAGTRKAAGAARHTPSKTPRRVPAKARPAKGKPAPAARSVKPAARRATPR